MSTIYYLKANQLQSLPMVTAFSSNNSNIGYVDSTRNHTEPPSQIHTHEIGLNVKTVEPTVANLMYIGHEKFHICTCPKWILFIYQRTRPQVPSFHSLWSCASPPRRAWMAPGAPRATVRKWTVIIKRRWLWQQLERNSSGWDTGWVWAKRNGNFNFEQRRRRMDVQNKKKMMMIIKKDIMYLSIAVYVHKDSVYKRC